MVQEYGGTYLVRGTEELWANIYWGKLLRETNEHVGVFTAFLMWKPWIVLHQPYVPPPDPPHVTLFYDRQGTEWYEEKWQEQVEGTHWEINSEYLYVAPEGVAADVVLTQEQQTWYMMSEEAVPHVSLALHPGHEAKELGGMTKRAKQASDWAPTQIAGMAYSPSTQTYRIDITTTDYCLLEHTQVPRHHGRERTDHPAAQDIIDSMPESL